MKILYITLLAFGLDVLFGDPEGMPHIIRLIGRGIGSLDTYFRSLTDRMSEEKERRRMERLCGVLLCVLMLGGVWIAWTVVTCALYRLSWWAGLLFEGLLAYQLLALKSLRVESMKVCTALEKGDTKGARQAVSRIVGRDTERLDEAGIIRAAVETVAENASDGVLAPLCFLVLGGTLPMLLYKTVNTMDSMIGYKNDTYRYFGTCAARLDDVLNLIPSRLCGLLLVAAAPFCKADGKEAFRIFQRDRGKHASPNSAQTEATMAGALHLRLAGDAWYFGELHEKPYIGDDQRSPEPADIRRANRLTGTACLLGLVLLCGLRLAVVLL